MRTALPTGTVTFLFTDLEGSTRLLQKLGTRYHAVLDRHHAILRDAIGAHAGVEVSTEGDAFFAVFQSAGDAVAATIDAQRALAAEPWPDGERVRVRMGLHTGEGQLGGDNYLGLDVHRAARIAAAGYGGQVLLSGVTRSLVEGGLPEGASLADLGAHRLKDLAQPEQLAQVLIAGLEQDFPPPRTLETPVRLPAEMSSFVGREQIVEAVSDQLQAARLLTLVGPGGTGKTRLAIRVAAGFAARLPDGIFFVDLAPLSDPDLVGPSAAHAVGLAEQADRPIVEQLRVYLRERALLLIFDNFEHLLPATLFLGGLLADAPRLKVLATSRAALNLYGERTFAVPPLTLPELNGETEAAALAENEAVALFLERARAARSDFALTPSSTRAVAEICVRLDGLPLAIELAASRAKVLEPSEILVRLKQHRPVLTSAAENMPARHRTLQATIDWSAGLLEPAAREMLARLSIFAGGCTLEAAESVCNPDDELGLDTLDAMASLVDHSLVRRVQGIDQSRYNMLETIREYAHDRLQADGALDLVARRHSEYFRDLAEIAEAQFMGPEQATWLDRFQLEHDNVRAALGRAQDAGDVEIGLRLGTAVWRFWLQRGYLREGRSWLEALLAREPAEASLVRARAMVAHGGLTYWLNDADATERAYEAAVSLYRSVGDRGGEAEALYNLAFVPVMRSDPAEAKRRFEVALSLASELGLPKLAAITESSLGITMVVAGDPQPALAILERARRFFEADGDRFQAGWVLAEMGQAYRALGDYGQGRAKFLESLRLHADATNLPGIGAVLNAFAALEAENGRFPQAMRLSGAARTLMSTTGASAPAMFTRVENSEQLARAGIGDEAADRELAVGRAMTTAEAIAYALSDEDGASSPRSR